MYIPEFWCGVLGVVFAEIVTLIVVGVIATLKGGKK